MLFAIKGEQAHQVMQCQVNILVQLIQTDNLKSNLDVMKSNFQNPCLVPTAHPARKEHGLLVSTGCRHHVVRKYVQVNWN